ncbi:MAG TPA: MBL fold metallo-hydrolase [Bacteroidia bacterium]|nr:MBL fold metallo-hydrolase [Bacteroidia bacterium]
MSLFITSLNSGSNGNCYYIANETEAVLVDVGISCREVEKRLTRLGLNMSKVKAVFISHEHSDHIKGVKVLAKKYALPVYITSLTHSSSGLFIAGELLRTFNAYSPVKVGGLEITAFPKLHDCAEPHSFVVSGNGVNIGVFTDIGRVCHHVINNFKICNAVFLETNYDEEMLEEGNYPFYLKKRIRGGHGHLSNKEALELFNNHKTDMMTHVFLSHLSRDNNHPSLVHDLFTRSAGNVKVVVATRDEETALYHITQSVTPTGSVSKGPVYNGVQTSLF